MRFPTKISSSRIWVAIPVDWLILHWYACGADRRSLGRWTVTWLPNFLGWVAYFIFLPMVLHCARFARESSAININMTIVNGGDWLWSPANIKGANKDAKIYVRRSTTLHNLLFCVHTLCMNYVTSTFLLVSSSIRSKQLLCFVQGQKREQKHTTKNFVGFHNHSLY